MVASKVKNKNARKERKVIVITGTPGVGKSTFSERLAEKLGALCINLNKLIMQEGLFKDYDEARKTFVADLPKIKKRLKELISKASEGYILVEGHLSHLLMPRDSVEMAFVLRCHPEALRQRLKSRGYTDAKIAENLQAEVLDVCLVEASQAYGKAKLAEIDLTEKKADIAAQEAYEIIMGLRKPSLGFVDWLSRLQAEGKLEDYLRGWEGASDAIDASKP
ncbi:MAG: adenylate kinase family protein [Candidatus Bathyarchaeia archaeon]